MEQSGIIEKQNVSSPRRRRLLLVCSHVVQYSSPVFREMARDPGLDILVALCSMQGAEPGLDPGFGVEVSWDTSPLDGYPWVHVPNRSPRPGIGHFFGLLNPALGKLIRDGKFEWLFLRQRLDRNPCGKMERCAYYFHDGGAQPAQLDHPIEVENALQEISRTTDPLAWQSTLGDVFRRGRTVEYARLSGGSHCPFTLHR